MNKKIKNLSKKIDEVETLISKISSEYCNEEMVKLCKERNVLDFPFTLKCWSETFNKIQKGFYFNVKEESKKITVNQAISEIEAILCEGDYERTFEDVRDDIESFLKPLNKEQRLKVYNLYKKFSGKPIPGERKGMQQLFKKLAS